MASTVDLVYACIALFFACALSSAGGVGGGGLNVPIFILLCGFNFTLSSSLSLYVVLGNSIAQMWLNYKQRHPKDERQPMIFYAFVVLLLPAQLGGGNIGGAIKRLLSEEILFILAFVILFIASSISLNKGLHKWAVESKELNNDINNINNDTKQPPPHLTFHIDATQRHQQDLQEQQNLQEVQNPVLQSTEATERPSQFFRNFEMEMSLDSPDIKPITSEDPERRTRQSSVFDDDRHYAPIQWPWPLIVVLCLMWLFQLAIRLVNTVQERCSNGYFISFCTIYLPLTVTCLWTLSYLHLQVYAGHTLPPLHVSQIKSVSSGVTAPGQDTGVAGHNLWNNVVEHIRMGGEHLPQWLLSTLNTSSHTQEPLAAALTIETHPGHHPSHNINHVDLQAHGWYLAIVVFCIGLVANLLGIGGAELISPLLLMLKVSPEVASATSGVMNLLNTLANVLINVLLLAHQRDTNNDDDETRENETAGLQMVLIVVGFFGGLIGRFSGLYVAKILKRASVIIFALVVGLYLTCVYYVYELAIDGADTSTKHFCSK